MRLQPAIDLSVIRDPLAFADVLCSRDFLSFAIRFYPLLSGGECLSLNWHLDALAHALDQVFSGKCRRLSVNMPPRQLKSIMTSVLWPAYLLGRNPSLNIVCISYSNELSAKHARDCRMIMSSSLYRRVFPRTRISPVRLAAHDFETTSRGGRLATSVNGTLTGRGGDIVIIDDPIKPDEAMSETTRNSVNTWLMSTMITRPNEKTRSAIVLVMQRLHQQDPAGVLMQTGMFEEIRFPAIATEDAMIPLTRGRTHCRRAGDVLHPRREPLRELLVIKEMMGSTAFSAQYQQDPVPAEGNMIHASWLRVYDLLPLKIGRARVVQSYDTASKEGVNCDWSVCITALVIGPMVYVINVWRKKVEFPELLQSTINRAQAFQADVLLVEDQASGTQLIQSLRSKQVRGVPLPIARKPDTDKRSRVAGVSAMMEAGQLLLPAEAPWLADFKSELLAFDNGKHDDQVDALSQLLTWVRDQERWGPPPRIGAPIYA